MKHARLLVFLCIVVVVAVVFKAPLSWALGPVEKEKYKEAQILLEKGKLEDALKIFSHLSADNPSHLGSRLGMINTTIEHSRILKAGKNPTWKDKIYQAFGDLKKIHRANIKSPEMYLSFAKCFWVNNAVGNAAKSLRKAFYYKPDYIEAFIFQGNMYYEEGRKLKGYYDDEDDDDFFRFRDKAKTSYIKALAGLGLNKKTKAMLHHHLGNTYYDLYGNKNKAKEQWNKAASLAPESALSEKVQKRLNILK
tara:strand:+ start:710 stop:1462 length:753 start_codon:yes stop_codon:yes gene_type:complete